MHDWMQESSAGGYLLHLSKLLVIESPSHLGPNPVLHPWHIFEPFARRSHRHRASLRLKILQAISQMKKLSNEKNQNNISASHIFNVHCPSSISLQLSLSLSLLARVPMCGSSSKSSSSGRSAPGVVLVSLIPRPKPVSFCNSWSCTTQPTTPRKETQELL